MKAIKAKCFAVSPTEPVSIFANQVNIVHQIDQGRLLLGQLHISAVGQRTFHRSLSGLRSKGCYHQQREHLFCLLPYPHPSKTFPQLYPGGNLHLSKTFPYNLPGSNLLETCLPEPHWNLPQPKNLSRTHIFEDVFHPVIRVLSISSKQVLFLFSKKLFIEDPVIVEAGNLVLSKVLSNCAFLQQGCKVSKKKTSPLVVKRFKRAERSSMYIFYSQIHSFHTEIIHFQGILSRHTHVIVDSCRFILTYISPLTFPDPAWCKSLKKPKLFGIAWS